MIYSEEVYTLNIGNGLYTAELSSSIPDGYLPEAYNFIATGETLENRLGLVQTTIDFKYNTFSADLNRHFNDLVQFDPSYPVVAWAQGGDIHFIRSSHSLSTLPSGDGYMKVTPAGVGTVLSLTQYNDRTYFSTTNGLYKITAYDWVSDTITYAAVTGAPVGLLGLFSFKDRLWGYTGDRLYYTEAINIVTSPYPETWSSTTQFIPFRGDGGKGIIQEVVPLGNRLIVFTTAGAFTLLVEGTSASWIKKTLDVKSRSTRRRCAFEAQGVVYYVNTTGVYATNGLSVVKISGSIEDAFFQPNVMLRHGLFYMEDGILLCITKIMKDGSSNTVYDAPASRIFYTKLDPVAWAEWGVEGTTDYPSTFDTDGYRIAEVVDVRTGVGTFLSLSPITILIVATSRSTDTVFKQAAIQLVMYDGYQNDLYVYNDTALVKLTDSIKMNLVTRFSDLDASIKTKNVKYAYLEAFTSDANHDLKTKFIVDNVAGFLGTYSVDDPSGEGVNLIKIPASFHCRRVSGVLSTRLQSIISQVKIKGFHLIVHTHRNEIADVR